MSSTHIFLEKDGNTVNIHFPGNVEFTGEIDLALNDLLNKGVDILAYSGKFHNTNQKSEKMSHDAVERESTQFENIANRLDNARARLHNVTEQVCKCVNTLNGAEPPMDEKIQANDSPGDSILSGLSRLLMELEDQIADLEHEQNRLSNLF